MGGKVLEILIKLVTPPNRPPNGRVKKKQGVRGVGFAQRGERTGFGAGRPTRPNLLPPHLFDVNEIREPDPVLLKNGIPFNGSGEKLHTIAKKEMPTLSPTKLVGGGGGPIPPFGAGGAKKYPPGVPPIYIKKKKINGYYRVQGPRFFLRFFNWKKHRQNPIFYRPPSHTLHLFLLTLPPGRAVSTPQQPWGQK